MDMPWIWIIMCGMLLEHYRRHMPKLANISCHTKSPFCRQYRICFMRSLIRQLYHFATDFNRVLLQQVGTNIEIEQSV